jgi:hypothetical protein
MRLYRCVLFTVAFVLAAAPSASSVGEDNSPHPQRRPPPSATSLNSALRPRRSRLRSDRQRGSEAGAAQDEKTKHDFGSRSWHRIRCSLGSRLRCRSAQTNGRHALRPRRRREAHASCVRLNSAFDEMREEREAERNAEGLRNAGESLQALGDEMLSRPRTTLSQPLSPPPEIGPTGLDDLYAVKRGDIRLHSPDGPVVGETTRIGPTPPSTEVLVP